MRGGACGEGVVETPLDLQADSPLDPETDPPPDPEADIPLGRNSHCSGRYVSYWNAFLFYIPILLFNCITS